MSPCCCFLSGITCRRTEDREVATAEMNIKTGAVCTRSLPRSSFLCHLTERLPSLSLRVFVYMWAAMTLWHAWGLPMRLNGYSDAAAQPNDLQNCRRGLEKGSSQLNIWVTEALSASLNCSSSLMFVFGEISGSLVLNRDSVMWRNDLISSIFWDIRRWWKKKNDLHHFCHSPAEEKCIFAWKWSRLFVIKAKSADLLAALEQIIYIVCLQPCHLDAVY